MNHPELLQPGQPTETQGAEAERYQSLTDREKQVLRLVADDQSNKEVARPSASA